MGNPSFEVLEINDDGTLTDISTEGEIKDILDSEKVVLVINDRKKVIWIWKGVNSRVRKKFISARQAQEIKGNRGLAFKIKSIEHGDEPKEFLKMIGGKVPTEESAETESINAAVEESQIIQPKHTDVRDTPIGSMNQSPIIQEPKFQKAPPIIQQSAPNPAQQIQSNPPIQQTQSNPPIQQTQPPIQAAETQYKEPQINPPDVLKEIESMSIPEGYKRELIIIGSQAYSIAEIKKTFMGEEKIDYKLDKTETPDGDFLGVDYTPRTIVKNGKIIAIELLRSLTGSKGVAVSANETVKALKIKMLRK
ncbi:MAG: hypothetical protein EU551_02885 [Promethearchaeota archaeon]|nr:MAG: hypothetical protein EU551_02885 [Candidatus Lokiarchaeota archaeon]